MNLQVCLPYQPCWFNCPMCVARGHKHKYIFDNLYASDKKKYLKALKKAEETDELIVRVYEWCGQDQEDDQSGHEPGRMEAAFQDTFHFHPPP